MQSSPFWLRWWRIRWYLRLYNITLRRLPTTSPRADGIILLLRNWWEKFSETEKQFILSKEEW